MTKFSISVFSLTLLVLVAMLSSAAGEQFCAEIQPQEADGASGYVALEILDGVATYSFDLNMNNFKNSTPCNLDDGLKFHIHSYWNTNTNLSAANSFCGSGYTGGHYDPNFACSTSSQSYSTQCTTLGRIPPVYTYSCNTTNYAKSKYSFCEIGDISGKHGTVFPASSTNLQYSLSNFLDYLPPYTYNYLRQDATSLMWASFVFHCAQNSNRLTCAKFSTTNLAPCASAFASMPSAVSSSGGSSGGSYSSSDIAISVIVPAVVLFAVGLALGCVFGRKNDVLLRSASRA